MIKINNILTEDSALAELIDSIVDNQKEFTTDSVKALIKTIFQIYNQDNEDVISSTELSTNEVEDLEQFGIELVPIKFSKTSIDKKQFEAITNYLPKLPEGRFIRIKNPKGVYLLKQELINFLGIEDYKVTVSNGNREEGNIKTLSIRKIKKK